MMAQKFIINDDKLIIGYVELHVNLLEKGMDRSKTVGGGRYYYNHLTNTMYFYGKSIEFGKVTKEQFDAAIKPPDVQGKNIVFTTDDKLDML